MKKPLSNTEQYFQYLDAFGGTISQNTREQVQILGDRTQWDEPTSPVDFNNLSVVALIMSAATDDMEMEGQLYLEMALEALSMNVDAHPLCAAHLALVQSLIGSTSAAVELAFSTLMNCSQLPPQVASTLELGLVYVQPAKAAHITGQADVLNHLYNNCPTAVEQAIALCAEVLWRSQFVYYSKNGFRFLQLSAQLLPDSAFLNLALGIACIFKKKWEGLCHLQRALHLNSDYASIYHALFLSSKLLGQEDLASQWLNTSREKAKSYPGDRSWQWTTLPSDSEFSYVLFGSLVMAVEPKIRSIVTSVLLLEGDWFEAEIEFWRDRLQSGMTVIDIGANAGVYTFSAAEKVGPTGRVFAVEPFADCVQCLEETRRINQLDWVTICAGAASDRSGNALLAVQGSSELNEIVTDEAVTKHENIQTVECFTLDDLIDRHSVKRVDWLKIDAEGHEINVLKGSERLLNRFSPGILYENISRQQTNNNEVMEYLIRKGYKLFQYQPFTKKLICIDTGTDLVDVLNVIAIRQG